MARAEPWPQFPVAALAFRSMSLVEALPMRLRKHGRCLAPIPTGGNRTSDRAFAQQLHALVARGPDASSVVRPSLLPFDRAGVGADGRGDVWRSWITGSRDAEPGAVAKRGAWCDNLAASLGRSAQHSGAVADSANARAKCGRAD